MRTKKSSNKSKNISELTKRRRRILAYSFGTLGLVLLVTAAFFGPEIVFAMQDDIRCRAMVVMSPEEVDITSFNTGYETDLYKRLKRFAEGLAEGRQYYCTVQDMELTTEVADWMVSEQGYYQEGFQVVFWNLGLIPEEVFGYNLIGWKRCVIYGDDFAGGVNFILWYIELGDHDEPTVRLLVDGETGDIYGIRTNFDAYFDTYFSDGVVDELGSSLLDYYGFYDENMLELCLVLGDTYGALDISDRLTWLYSAGCDFYPAGGSVYVDVPAEYEALQKEKQQMEANAGKLPDYEWTNRYSIEDIQDFLQRLQWRVSEDEKCLDFDFPYDESSLGFRIRLDGKLRTFNRWGTLFPDITFGFPEIYERIPAFMEDWD